MLAKAKKLECYSDIIIYFDITQNSEITKYILENIKLKKRDKSKKRQEKRYKEDHGNFFFLVTRLNLII